MIVAAEEFAMTQDEEAGRAEGAGKADEGLAVEGWRPPERRRWRVEYGRAMAAALKRSGETHATFCIRHGLSVNQLKWWLLRLRRMERRGEPASRARSASTGAPTPQFAPVRIAAPKASAKRGTEPQLKDLPCLGGAAAPRTEQQSGLEVVLRCGRILHVARDFDEGLLRRVVLTLEGLERC